jgi:hypothetical protein
MSGKPADRAASSSKHSRTTERSLSRCRASSSGSRAERRVRMRVAKADRSRTVTSTGLSLYLQPEGQVFVSSYRSRCLGLASPGLPHRGMCERWQPLQGVQGCRSSSSLAIGDGLCPGAAPELSRSQLPAGLTECNRRGRQGAAVPAPGLRGSPVSMQPHAAD